MMTGIVGAEQHLNSAVILNSQEVSGRRNSECKSSEFRVSAV